jgi:hypothetical protein
MQGSRWQFAEVRFRGARNWTWRRMNASGTLTKGSVMLESFGAVVRDAIRNGFDTQKDSWDITSATCSAHFEPQLRPALVEYPPLGIKRAQVIRRQRRSAESCASTLQES